MIRRKVLGVFLLHAFLLPTLALAQGPAVGSSPATASKATAVYTAPKADLDKIKDEGMNRSQVMQTLSYLSDVIGQRRLRLP